MFNRRKFVLAAPACAAVALCACAAPLAGIPTYAWEQPVPFHGVAFRFLSIRTASTLSDMQGRTLAAQHTFVVLKVALVNRYVVPLPPGLQPQFRLLDPARVMAMPDPPATAFVSAQGTGMALYVKNMPPEVELVQELVYDVPVKPWRLLVTMPTGKGLSFNGNVSPLENHFMVDLSSRLGAGGHGAA